MKSKQIILSIVLCAILMLEAAHIAAQSLTSEQNKAITGAKQGGIIKLEGFPLKDLPLIDYEKIILPGPLSTLYQMILNTSTSWKVSPSGKQYCQERSDCMYTMLMRW